MRAHDLSHDPILVRKRQPRVEYYMDHAHGRFYILTNAGQEGEYEVKIQLGAIVFSTETCPITDL